MVTEVGTLARMLGAYVEEKREVASGSRGELVTRDFLGGGGGCVGAGGGVKELDLDLAAPAGWERRLDLTSGEVSLHRRTGSTTAAASKEPGRSPPPLLPLFPSQPTLDLGLLPPAPEYQSVCTLDKVKSALDRLAAAPPPANGKAAHHPASSPSASGSRPGSRSSSRSEYDSPASSSSTTSSRLLQQRRRRLGGEGGGESGTTTEEDGGLQGGDGPAMVATGCPSCLSYVLISRSRPCCPRCAAPVPSPPPKKPRLDLNLGSPSSATAAVAGSR